MALENAAALAKALQIYENRTVGTSTDVNQALTKAGLRKSSFDKSFPAMFSIHALDLKNILESEQYPPEVDDAIILAYNNTLEELRTKYKDADSSFVQEIINDYTILIEMVNSIIGIDGKIRSKSWAPVEAKLLEIKKKFSEPLIVYYIPSAGNNLGSIKLIYNSFNNLKTIVNKILKKHLKAVPTYGNINLKQLVSSAESFTSEITNWGHTPVKQSSGEISLISGKIVSSILSFDNIGISSSNTKLLEADFIQNTGQLKTVISMHQGINANNAAVFNLVVDSGYFQSVRLQSTKENQGILSTLETFWKPQKAVQNLGLLSAFNVNSVEELADKLIRVKSSPSLLDKIEAKLLSQLTGKPYRANISSHTLLNSTKKITNITGKFRVNRGKEPPTTTIRTKKGQFTSLTSIQNLINRKLAEQIKRNMGSGFSKSVLNYRTGRFASSAQVERLTMSKEGMITAFYSYMKSPYQTFEPGFKQGSPKSRDPKLLIGKSIREIAAESMSNRLRAVAV